MIIWKVVSILRNTVNGLLGHPGRVVPGARRAGLRCPWAGTGFGPELSQVVFPDLERN